MAWKEVRNNKAPDFRDDPFLEYVLSLENKRK